MHRGENMRSIEWNGERLSEKQGVLFILVSGIYDDRNSLSPRPYVFSWLRILQLDEREDEL